ncbi:hypothetical protein MLD38_030334 [Melastoma candidum]|uniref:Uncharacterized protein n=1 Tax=Melastoma candidum TaxID=119954 RepID=A0ACB9MRK8_9MYRT|nr:hypothetical protein MLD38_030334 [Melastoma candidum]
MDSSSEDDAAVAAEEAEAPASPSPPKNVYNDPDDGRQRFLLELEFVQCLANPTYIHYLAQNRYFEDEAFIGYLKYLMYWKRPEYVKFIMYPHCLYFLELLQNANFRNAMAHPGNKELAHRQQFFFWKNYRNNRLKHIAPRPLPEPAVAPPTSAALPSTVPPVPSVPASAPVVSPAPAVLSPMQYAVPPGSSLPRNDIRNVAVDRRKRKYATNLSLGFCALSLPSEILFHLGESSATDWNTSEPAGKIQLDYRVRMENLLKAVVLIPLVTEVLALTTL